MKTPSSTGWSLCGLDSRPHQGNLGFPSSMSRCGEGRKKGVMGLKAVSGQT